ncbi:hypothetical protein T484DRAFT_1758612 [Baffinella frigidus]|nr:hypothetical protein T484DRAFT_1758612 [Cryptophyta sp. CCMP2293]
MNHELVKRAEGLRRVQRHEQEIKELENQHAMEREEMDGHSGQAYDLERFRISERDELRKLEVRRELEMQLKLEVRRELEAKIARRVRDELTTRQRMHIDTGRRFYFDSNIDRAAAVPVELWKHDKKVYEACAPSWRYLAETGWYETPMDEMRKTVYSIATEEFLESRRIRCKGYWDVDNVKMPREEYSADTELYLADKRAYKVENWRVFDQ